MRRWWLVFALLLSLGVNIGVLGTFALHRLRPPEAREHRGAGGERGEPGDRQGREQRRLARLGRLADRMDLAGPARERFLARQRSYFVATSRDRAELRRVHTELRRELTAAAPDRARIEALVGEEGRLHVKLERAFTGNVLASREMLDPRQEAVYLEFVNRLSARRQGAGESDGSRFRHRRRRGSGS